MKRLTIKKHFDLIDKIYYFDKKLKAEMIEKHGSTQILQRINAWQALVGGSLVNEDDSDDVPNDVRNNIETKISDLIDDIDRSLNKLK